MHKSLITKPDYLRKIACISLILIFLFNLFGYKVLLHYWEQEESLKLLAKLDQQQYNKEDLVEVKIPLNLPYHNNWKEFERFDGEIDIDGMHYRYVMRKVYNDSLILLCIPNEIKTKMQTARDQFFSLVNDLQKSSGQKKSGDTNTLPAFKFGGDYTFQQTGNEWNAIVVPFQHVYGPALVAPVISASLACPWQPPDFLSPLG
ncbi:MAG: hypothetical protein ACTHMM_02380 [Agriterribacter sp.]